MSDGKDSCRAEAGRHRRMGRNPVRWIRGVALVAAAALTGCSSVDVERSFRECPTYDRDAVYTVTRDTQRMECRR